MIERIRSPKPVRIYLREWRQARGKTQQQLADLLDTNKGQISNWENGKRTMTLDVQAALAYALDIEPQDLFRDPARPSADELLRRATPAQQDMAIDIIERIVGANALRLYPMEDAESFDGLGGATPTPRTKSANAEERKLTR